MNSTPEPYPIAMIWADAMALHAQLIAERDSGSDADQEAGYDRLFALEDAVLDGTIHSHADAIAKLKAVAVWWGRGEKADESDGPALAQAIAWLEANPYPAVAQAA